eukprot:gene6069-12244_t
MTEYQNRLDFQALYYTSHHNWSWVVEEAIRRLTSESSNGVVTCKKIRELPSQINAQNISKDNYALFRIEGIYEITEMKQKYAATWMVSRAFEFLDPKDALYSHLLQSGAQHCMPSTILLPWDTNDESTIQSLPSSPALLKASLGSGGFGLYFVQNTADVIQVITSHSIRARNEHGFLDRLQRDYGHIPYWSLQKLIPSVRVLGNKRCQLRTYVIFCGSHTDHKMFVYSTHEVRIPSWDTDLDQELDPKSHSSHNEHATTDVDTDIRSESEIDRDRDTADLVLAMERECCGNSSARPYNRDRNKTETNRLLLRELSEIAHMDIAVSDCVKTAFLALRPAIEKALLEAHKKKGSGGGERTSSSFSADSHPSEMGDGGAGIVPMAIAGVDLMLSVSECNDIGTVGSVGGSVVLTPLIVEINNNPAMPGSNKLMSDEYREHLIQLCSRMMRLGLSNGTDHVGFDRLW